MCLFNAACVIVQGSLASTMSLGCPVHLYDFPAFCLQ